jgi:hypothetical protein
MDFEAAVKELSSLVGSEMAVNLTDERLGPSDGYRADFSGTLTHVEEPIAGIDAPVYYFRLDDEYGFGLHEAMFDSAGWETKAGVRSLRVELRGGIVLTISI